MLKSIKYLVILLLYINSALFAEKEGIKGKIVDSKTKVSLSSITVAVIGTDNGTITDNEGYFKISGISEGLYKIRVSCVGYQTYIKPDIRVARDKETYIGEIALVECPLELSEVTVTAGSFNEMRIKGVSSINITKDEIRRSPGAGGDIFRALSVLPGVTTEGGELSGLSVRGGGPRDNLILIDNIPFTKLSHFDEGGLEGESAGGGRFSIFTTNIIERADFHAGGFPARYGGKNASILNMDIKEGNIKDISVSGYYDLFGWEADYDGPLPINNKSGLLVSIRHVNFENVLRLVDEEGHGIPSYDDAVIKFSSDINTDNKITLLSIYSDDYYKRTKDHIFKNNNINSNSLFNHSNYRYLAGGTFRHILSPSSFFTATMYYYYDNMSAVEGRVNTAPDFGITRNADNCFFRDNISNDKREEKTFGSKLDFTLLISKHFDIMAGIEYKLSRYNYNMQLNGIDTIFVFNRNDYRESADKMFLTIRPEEFNEANNISNKYLAAYSEISGNFHNLTVNFGSRFENYSHNNTFYYSPRINFSYAVGSSITINGAAGIFYQSPELFYLAMDKQNINLKNEKAFHFILGTSIYLNEDLKFTAEAYYKKLEDLISWKDRTELKFGNNGTGHVRGIDFALVRRYTDKFFGQLSYSYCSSIRNDNDGTGEYVYGFNKTHMFSIMAGYQLNNNLSITAKWYISSGYPADEFIIHSNVLSDLQKLRYSKEIVKKGGRFLPANHSLNIRADYRAQFSFFALDLYLDILNVYSAQNITREEFLPQTGLNNTESLGFMPTFGFRLEF